jgi:hypothetical protein
MAEKSEIMEALEALETHCRAPLMAVEQRAAWMRDWCDDLAEFPIHAIQHGCKAWRHSQGVTKFPTPGQLLPLIRANVAQRPAGAVGEPWRELSDDEYRALSLEDKIRHQRILCTRAYSRAGPQTKPADDMPESWHRWRQIGRNHEEEVATLKGKLKLAAPSAA